ncbi:hypothetical protein OOK31_25425 [Streptomyces sp. NBC_00249]|nr:hypothetical protein [Streptomyces sp. NBC_00249]MCX5197198.1 hypothetical protein [Streptomyces sp. NBC_00249]
MIRIVLGGLVIWCALASLTAIVLCRIAHVLKRRHRRSARR